MKKEEYRVWLDTNRLYTDNRTSVLISSFVVWASIFIAMLFPLFGFGLAFFLMCTLCIGFKKIVLDIIRGNEYKVENVFDYYAHSLSAFCLRVCSMVLILLWSLLLIIPGVICGLNYSLVPYIFADEPDIGTIACLEKSKKLVYGHRAELLIIFLMEALITILVATLASCFVIIFNFIAVMPLWFNVVVPIIITLFCFFVVILPYFEMLIGNYYVNLLKQSVQEKTTVKKTSKSASTKR